MLPKLIIRKGLPADAEKLAALAIQVWLHTYAKEGISSTISGYVLSEFTAEKFSALLTSTSATIFVAEVNTNIVGYALIDVAVSCPEPTTSNVQLATLYVQEHFVGNGVGSALLAIAEALAVRQTNKPLWLTVNAKNNRAIAFYAKYGYTKIGITQFRLGNKDHENHVLVGREA
jgi:diamine N-acetyltransferase